MEVDKRFYTRYPVFIQSMAAHEKGYNFHGELVDISIEGAKLKAEGIHPIKEGDIILLVIKAEKSLKLKGEVKWIKSDRGNLLIGLQFRDLDFQTTQALSAILSELALSSLSDKYLR